MGVVQLLAQLEFVFGKTFVIILLGKSDTHVFRIIGLYDHLSDFLRAFRSVLRLV